MDVPEEHVQLMAIWRDRNEMKVAREVRRLAEQLPALKVFEWYPGGAWVSALWKWEIMRGGTGPEKSVKMVTGRLAWDGCSTGDPPSISSLVGQELAYYNDRYGKIPWRDPEVD